MSLRKVGHYFPELKFLLDALLHLPMLKSQSNEHFHAIREVKSGDDITAATGWIMLTHVAVRNWCSLLVWVTSLRFLFSPGCTSCSFGWSPQFHNFILFRILFLWTHSEIIMPHTFGMIAKGKKQFVRLQFTSAGSIVLFCSRSSSQRRQEKW